MSKEEDMSNTFVAEVGQKSAIFNQEEEIESLEEPKENSFPEVKIDPPTEMPTILEEGKISEPQNEEKANQEEDEEFLEAKKKKKSKKYKKRNPFITFLLMIICLALGAGASYYYFEIYNKTDDNSLSKSEVADNSNGEIKEEKKNEEIEPRSIFVKRLIEKYDGSFTAAPDFGNYKALYSKDKTTPDDFDDNYIQILGLANIRAPFYVSKEELNDSLTELFGKDKFKAKEESIDFGICKYYKYANGYYRYEEGSECGGTSDMTINRKIVKAEKNDSNLYINVAVEVITMGNVYKAYDIINFKGVDQLTDYTYETFDIEKDYAKLNQYKYSFKYDKDNNNYYLESIELIK